MILFESSVQFSDHLLNTCYMPVAELGACMNRHCPCPQGIPSSHKGQFVNREFILLKWVVHSCGSSPEVMRGHVRGEKAPPQQQPGGCVLASPPRTCHGPCASVCTAVSPYVSFWRSGTSWSSPPLFIFCTVFCCMAGPRLTQPVCRLVGHLGKQFQVTW